MRNFISKYLLNSIYEIKRKNFEFHFLFDKLFEIINFANQS